VSYPQLATAADLTFGAPASASTDLTFGDVGAPPPSGGAKYWNGSTWVSGTVRRWNGSTWVAATMRRWDGAAWITV
jgi:hypothetical protein